MRISVPTETASRELRVALPPDSAGRLVKSGLEVAVQAGAGQHAGFRDDAYTAVGVKIVPDARSVVASTQVVVKVQPPTVEEIGQMSEGTSVISLMRPGKHQELAAALAKRSVNALALELVPRITRAQSMDVLSSQSTVAGYKAVLLGAAELGKFLPMLTTAGNISPARVFVIGAGVSGLQAIATARRLGGVVSAFDVRPAAREQVQSLGATFVATELVSASAEAAGGYARAQTNEEQQRTLSAIAGHIKDVDLVITTAQIPGRPAPTLITSDMVKTMRAGAVIVDLAVESGGNCELSKPGETVHVNDVAIMGPLNLPSSVPYHASQMFGRNILALLQHLVKDGALVLDPADEITGAMLMVYQGKVLK
jgi:NAD(P) transhydrogenase subunit alpha